MKNFIFLWGIILYTNFCLSMTEADRANLVTQSYLAEIKKTLEKDISKINADILVLSDKNEFTNNDKAQLKMLEKNLKNLEQQLNTFEQKCNDALKEKATSKEFNDLSNEVNTLKNQFEQLNNKPADINTLQLSGLQNEVQNFKKEYNNFKRDQNNEINDVKNAIVKHDDITKQLLIIIKGKKGLKGLEDHVHDFQRNITSLNDDLQENETDLRNAFKRVKKIEDALELLTEELENML